MKIHFEKDDRKEELEFTGTVKQLLDHFNLNTEEVLVVRSGEALLDDDPVANEDEISFLSVISGG